MAFGYCECHSFETFLIANSAFPTREVGVLIHIRALEAYRALNLRGGYALNAFVDVMRKFQPAIKTSFTHIFSDAYGVYRSVIFEIENIQDMLSDGCPACPGPHEPGEHYWAVDGNFRLFRYRSSGKVKLETRFSKVFHRMAVTQVIFTFEICS